MAKSRVEETATPRAGRERPRMADPSSLLLPLAEYALRLLELICSDERFDGVGMDPEYAGLVQRDGLHEL
jgi:hypothetical protein